MCPRLLTLGNGSRCHFGDPPETGCGRAFCPVTPNQSGKTGKKSKTSSKKGGEWDELTNEDVNPSPRHKNS